MSRSASFGLGLLFLLTALVAAAWGAHQLGLTEPSRASYARAEAPAHADPVCAYVPGRLYSFPSATEIAEARASFAALPVCYYVPGQMFAQPSGAQIAEARGSWAWPAHVCLYDPSRGFGAFPSASALVQTRGLLWGFNPWWAGLGSLMAAIGTMSLGHGLLVGGLSIFNPAFIAVGWWLLLPEIALAQAGWIGVAGLSTAALTLLAPRYVRRRAAVEAMRRTPRGWLTPKRVALVGGGWMMTVGVLASVYPNVAKLIPQMPGITVSSSNAPKTGGGPRPVADVAPASTSPAPQATLADPVAVSGMPLLPPAVGGDGGQATSEQPSAAPASPTVRMASFSPSFASYSGSSGGDSAAAVGGGDAASNGSNSGGSGSVLPTVPATTSFAALTNYLPPSTPSATPTPTVPATPAASTDPSPAAPSSPAPVEIAANDDARSVIADSPIIDTAEPLPSSPDAVLPVSTPVTPDAVGGPAGDPGTSSTPDSPGSPPATLAPANPGALDGDTTPVPEPGMLGLFGLAVLALARRRAK